MTRPVIFQSEPVQSSKVGRVWKAIIVVLHIFEGRIAYSTSPWRNVRYFQSTLVLFKQVDGGIRGILVADIHAPPTLSVLCLRREKAYSLARHSLERQKEAKDAKVTRSITGLRGPID
jgi:hypothetical protein